MDIAFDKESWSHSPARPGLETNCRHPEWDGLFSRLQAAQQSRLALDPEVVGDLTSESGSFNQNTASLITLFDEMLRSVNPVDSANRNASGDIIADVAGTSSTGERG